MTTTSSRPAAPSASAPSRRWRTDPSRSSPPSAPTPSPAATEGPLTGGVDGRSSRTSTRSSWSPASAPTSPGSPRSGSTSTRCCPSPTRLAPLIDPNVHSCGTVYPHGVAELAQPEQGLYLAGMKSYGRAPSFLALTGFEQTRSIVAAVAGDHEAAARVELVLPEAGVCGGSGQFDGEPADRSRLLFTGRRARTGRGRRRLAADDLRPHRRRPRPGGPPRRAPTCAGWWRCCA